MPRKARIVVPKTPHHIRQRGHNRQTVFAHDEDYQYDLENLFEWKKEFDCRVYAWCLMTNHVHLIIQPGGSTEGLSQLMKRLAGRQTRYVNRLEQRTGSLWEGRFKSSPIETDTYLLACCRYIELNPVRARMVVRPEDYLWSSYRMKTGLQEPKGKRGQIYFSENKPVSFDSQVRIMTGTIQGDKYHAKEGENRSAEDATPHQTARA